MPGVAKRLVQALQDQGKSRVNLGNRRSKHPKPRSTSQKRAMRLAEGFPLSTGSTPKGSPKTKAAGLAKILAKAIVERASKKDKGISRPRRGPIKESK